MMTDRSNNLREVASEPTKGSTYFGQLLPLLDEYLLVGQRSQGYRILQQWERSAALLTLL